MLTWGAGKWYDSRAPLRGAGEPWKLNSELFELWIPSVFWLKQTDDRLKLTNTQTNPCKWKNNEKNRQVSNDWVWSNYYLRVWSWLRTNAGGVPNTCKSNGGCTKYFGTEYGLSGERVSNTWATCPRLGDNIVKTVLIPHDRAPGIRSAWKE